MLLSEWMRWQRSDQKLQCVSAASRRAFPKLTKIWMMNGVRRTIVIPVPWAVMSGASKVLKDVKSVGSVCTAILGMSDCVPPR